MNLLEDFKNNNQHIINPSDTFLLAVSGGIDSVVMFDLCLKSNLNFSVAHCNFSLRGEESNRDEKFVEQLAQANNIQFFSKTFDTNLYALTNKISIQEAARNLRYDYFNELIVEHHFKYVLVAHNQNDSMETFFINTLRGTGIKGLSGIKKVREKIYRPLIFASRKMIEEYAKHQKISFVEDSSNLKDDYLRNKIRHNLIPTLVKINTNTQSLIVKNIEYISKEVSLYEWFLNDWIRKNVVYINSKISINISTLLETPNPALILKHLLKPDNIDLFEIEKFLESKTGAIIYTSINKVLKNRTEILIENITTNTTDTEYFIDENTETISGYKIETIAHTKDYIIDKNANVAQLDFDKLYFPLKIRNWKHGDFFFPLGMKNKKLLSDFLINNKISMFEKENIKVMESNGEIVWVVGLRIDNRFAMTEETKNIYKISCLYHS